MLAFGLLISLGQLVYLSKLQHGRMLPVLELNTEAAAAVKEVIENCKAANK